MTIALLAGALLCCGSAQAQSQNSSGTHWALSAFFGTGWYDVANSESVFIVRTPFQQSLRQSSWTDGQGSLGIELHYPVTVGLHNVSDLGDISNPDNFATYAFTPGIELEIPVTEKWYLRPLVHAGWGKETNDGDSAWIYYGGIKSRYSPGKNGVDWSLLNGLYYAGYNSDEGGNGSVSMAMTGAEFHHLLKSGFAGRDDLQINWHLTYSWLFDEANFETRSGLSQTIRDQWELGIALAPHNSRFKLWFMSFEQLGLSYRRSSDGDFRAISLNFSSPFR